MCRNVPYYFLQVSSASLLRPQFQSRLTTWNPDAMKVIVTQCEVLFQTDIWSNESLSSSGETYRATGWGPSAGGLASLAFSYGLSVFIIGVLLMAATPAWPSGPMGCNCCWHLWSLPQPLVMKWVHLFLQPQLHTSSSFSTSTTAQTANCFSQPRSWGALWAP